MTRLQRLLAAAGVLLAVSAPPALAQLKADLFVSGLSAPVAFVQSPTHPNVQMVVEQGGRVRVVQGGVLLAQDFLNLTGTTLFDGEQGLLGLAFAPDYASSGRVYVNFVNMAGDTVIARFLRSAGNPLQVNPSSRFDLVWPDGNAFIDQPAGFPNHKGGNLVFGPDGLLYIGMGDGGSGNDPFNFAQNPASLLGKILRIDVGVPLSNTKGYAVPPSNPFFGQPGVLGEIWAIGVRNPWKFTFDDPNRGGTGALVMGDVGQNSWEEVNYEPQGAGGRNYGWRNREGAHDNVTTVAPYPIPLTEPITEYSHAVGHSITGGYVYRGSALGASYVGRYFFADFSFSRVWSIAITNPGTAGAGAADLVEHSGQLGAAVTLPSSFGVDADGELYVVSYSGSIYKIGLNAAPGAGGCPTVQPAPDWVCVNGNWLPPGFPGTTPPTPPPTPPPSPSPTGCTTPQPASDWTCVNGNWLPPGFPGGTPPTTPPPTTPPPTPPPPTGCTTPQPASDWTCSNGNWLPPGFPGTTPPSTPPPTPPPTPTGCPGSDPFLGLPGLAGVCINGDWIPTELIQNAAATVQFHSTSGGFWALHLDDGRVFVPMGGLAPAFQTNGRRVTFTGKVRIDLPSTPGAIVEVLSIS
jgi:glucose/arabinose dehydrogenase